MNQGFSVAAATVAIADRLHVLIGDSVPGARVTTLNPGSESLRSGDPFVNLYLFRTTRNGFVSNDDLPTRGPTGRPQNSPVMKLDLDYMITFFGDDTRLDPQRLLGLVVGGLNAEPYIPRDAIRAARASTPWLGSADPEPPSQQICVTPLNMPPDAMARLWSEFVNVPYQLTQLYTATPIALEYSLPVAPVLPVRRIGLYAQPSRSIIILDLANAANDDLPLVAGGQMAVRLPNPKQSGLSVLLNGFPASGVTPGFDSQGYGALLVDLSDAQPGPLMAGPLSVQVVRRDRGTSELVAQSPVHEAEIVPALAGAPVVDAEAKQIEVTMALPLLPEAPAAMLLFPRGGAAAPSQRIACLPRTAPGSKLAAPIAGIAAGTYLLSVEIDGVATLLDFSGTAYTGPLIEIAGS